MAVHIEENATLQTGAHRKKIDAAGIHMTMDAMQRYQYTYPVKSLVREILSNSIDSIREKLRARAILTGQAQVSDYFADLEGEIYKDSKWKPEYYDLKWLDFNQNKAILKYRMSGLDRDTVIFEDRGVGLGQRRLEGYFDLTFSTKRLDKGALGKWGVGAKSPLSTGEKYYIMETWYNGRYFKFQIYDHTYYSLVPQYDLEKGKENEFIIFENDEDKLPVYWEPTEEKNGVRITLSAKKHHRQQYVDAVKSQMLYFDNIDCILVHTDGREETIPYKANILFENDLIVMSDNNYYSKPHLLLNGVNYGYIDWSELELQDIQGNIGIKVAPEDVEVNMSRESVLWTEKTKEKVLKRFEEVVNIASEMIQEELKETDLVKWIRVCNSISGRWSSANTILGKLANIVDLSQVKPKFGPEPSIVWKNASPLGHIFNRQVSMHTDTKAGVTKKKVQRDVWSASAEKPIFLLKKEEKVSNRKDKYLLTLYPQGFNEIHEPYETMAKLYEAHDNGEVPETLFKYYDEMPATKREDFSMVRVRTVWEYLTKSTEVIWYSEVKVPDDFTGSDEEEDVTAVEQTVEEAKLEEVARITAEERRKLEGKTIITTPTSGYGERIIDANGNSLYKYYSFVKMEVPIRSINDWNAEEIYYGTDADAELMHFVAMLTRDTHPDNAIGKPRRSYGENYVKWKEGKWWRLNKGLIADYKVSDLDAYNMQHFFDTQVMLIKVAQNNTRYYRDFQRIQEFFISIKNNTITMSNTLIKWNTARIVREKLGQVAFLYNFDSFNPAFASMYQALTTYVDKNYREVSDNNGTTYGINTQTYIDLLSHLDNVRKFQDFVAKGRPADEIAKLANELFGNRELQDGMAVDPKIMLMLEDVISYAVATGPLFNYIPTFTGYSTVQAPAYTPGVSRSKHYIPEELEMEVRMLLEHKGVLDYKTTFEIEEEIEQQAADIENASPLTGYEQAVEDIEQVLEDDLLDTDKPITVEVLG